MFKFLKERLKSAVSLFSRKAEEEADDVEVKEEAKPAKEKSQKQPSKPSIVKVKKEEINEPEEKKENPKEKTREDKKEKLQKDKKKPKPAEELIMGKPKEKPAEAEEKTEEPSQEKEKRTAEGTKPGFFKRLFGKKKEEDEEEKLEERKPAHEEKAVKSAEKEEEKTKEEEKPAESGGKGEEPSEEEKKGFFGKVFETITRKKLSEDKFESLFWDLEVVLMENNVAIEVIEKIKSDMKNKLVDVPLERGNIDKIILNSLKHSIEGLFETGTMDLVKNAASKKEKPYIISFVGVNGAGKTTTIAKVANMFLKKKMTCILAASDTFRAASQEQLQEHADKLGIKMIKHDYGADPAAVAFDAIKMAKAKNIDVVTIDTAGRLHSNINLMDELKKIDRVAKPDVTIFIGESITGNDCIEQAVKFNEAIDFDAIILTKADVDEKGGAAISVSYVTKKPIIYVGTGQTYDDLQAFNPDLIIKTLGL